MNAQVQMNDVAALAIGQRVSGGFFAGAIIIGGERFGLVVAPKAEGEREVVWQKRTSMVEGALSLNDGLTNTKAMLEANSPAAKWATELTIDGCNDYYIASQDETEVIYRNLKPTTEEDSKWARSGMNLHSVPPSLPYSHQPALQTVVEAFKEDGTEAFEEEAYWTSTQHAGNSGYAWYQTFDDGDQNSSLKDDSLRVRAVRRFKL